MASDEAVAVCFRVSVDAAAVPVDAIVADAIAFAVAVLDVIVETVGRASASFSCSVTLMPLMSPASFSSNLVLAPFLVIASLGLVSLSIESRSLEGDLDLMNLPLALTLSSGFKSRSLEGDLDLVDPRLFFCPISGFKSRSLEGDLDLLDPSELSTLE